jgi:hypothetical protein
MKLLDNLKGLLNIEPGAISATLKNIRFLNNSSFIKIEIEKNTTINGPIYIDKDKQVLNINYDALPINEKTKSLESLLDAESGTLIAFGDVFEKVNDVRKYLAEPESQELTYFRDKLIGEPYQILTRAMYIKKKFLEGNTAEVSKLKSELIAVYGEKAGVISNLCSANYFETFLKAKYEEMSKLPDFKREDFQQEFERLIRDFPVAVFVNASMSTEKVKEIIQSKIHLIKESKLNYLNIHGIGDENIRTIVALVEDIEKTTNVESKHIVRSDRTIILRIKFKLSTD